MLTTATCQTRGATVTIRRHETLIGHRYHSSAKPPELVTLLTHFGHVFVMVSLDCELSCL